eukprot:scaffold659145_cov61-Prasinocladus_malaysianus.AAC.1
MSVKEPLLREMARATEAVPTAAEMKRAPTSRPSTRPSVTFAATRGGRLSEKCALSGTLRITKAFLMRVGRTKCQTGTVPSR